MSRETFNKWQEFLGEQIAQNFEDAIEAIKSLGYDYSVNKNAIKVLHVHDRNRLAAGRHAARADASRCNSCVLQWLQKPDFLRQK